MQSSSQRLAASAEPLNTIRAEVDGSGTCYVPDHFAPEFNRLVAALDFARIYNGNDQLWAAAAVELAAAAQYARDLADKADACAKRAREMAR